MAHVIGLCACRSPFCSFGSSSFRRHHFLFRSSSHVRASTRLAKSSQPIFLLAVCHNMNIIHLHVIQLTILETHKIPSGPLAAVPLSTIYQSACFSDCRFPPSLRTLETTLVLHVCLFASPVTHTFNSPQFTAIKSTALSLNRFNV